MPPLVSVIIPTYNSADFICGAIKSVLNQTLKNVELIVVDDGSIDSTQLVLEEFVGKIKILRQTNRGPGAARNAGINLASGKYIVFLDSDDLLLPEMLSHQSSWLEAHPDIGLVYSDGYRLRKVFGRDLKILLSVTGDVKRIPPGKNLLDYLVPRNCFPIDVVMTRLTLLKKAGGFDETLTALEDWDLWYRIACQHPVFYLNEIVACYRVRKDSNSGDVRRNVKEYLRVMEKIEFSPQFPSSSRLARAEFYYLKGLQSLFLEDTTAAQYYYQEAFMLNPFHVRLFFGNLMFKLLGAKVIALYKVKRNLSSLRIFMKK